MKTGYALRYCRDATRKRRRIDALPISLVLGTLLLFASSIASAQDEVEGFRLEAAKRLGAEVRRLESLTVDAQVLAELARAEHFLGSVTKNRNDALVHYQSGLSHANQAIELQNGNRAGQLWGVVNSLKIFEIEKPVRALWMMDDLEAILKQLKVDDEAFEYAAADRVLALLYHKSPRWLIGSIKKAERHFREALRIAPDFPANRLLYADFMLDQNRVDDARAMISEWTTANKISDFPLYEMLWRIDLETIGQRLAERDEPLKPENARK